MITETTTTTIAETPVVRRDIPLGRSPKADAIVAARLKAAGKRVCHLASAAVTSDREAKIYYYTKWEKYGRKSYPRDRNGVEVHSCGYLASAGQVLVAELGMETRQFVARRGYEWRDDTNGICLVRLRDGADYHPTAGELFDGPSAPSAVVRELIKSLRANQRQRRANERQAAREERAADKMARLNAKQAARVAARDKRLTAQAERLGVWVCVADSRAYGNCMAGTLAFAQRCGLDPTKHYTPQQLLALANGDRQRVAGAVACALRRAKREISQGYCLLSDHQQ